MLARPVPARQHDAPDELKLNFISPASRGTLVAEARLFHSGRTTAVAEIEVRDDGGRLVAKGIATFLPMRS